MTIAPRLLRTTFGLALLALALALALAAISAANHTAHAQSSTPQAAFQLEISSGLVPLVVSPINTSTGADTFHWDFGDDTTSTSRNPHHIYTRPGLHVIELEACSDADCSTAIDFVNIEGRDSFDGGMLRQNRPVYGSINQPGDLDLWTFDAPAGSFATITLAPDPGSPLDPLLRLFAPDGHLIAFNDDQGASPAAGLTDFELPVSGAYTIETGAFLDTVGVYELSLDILDPDAVRAAFSLTPSTGVAPLTVSLTNESRNATTFTWSVNNDATSTFRSTSHRFTAPGRHEITLTACRSDDCDTARASVTVEADDGGVIRSDQPLNNQIDFEDDVDRFTFTAPIGAEISIEVVAADSEVLDTLLFLFDPSGDQIATDDDGGNGSNARIQNIILPRAGTYAIDAQAFPGGGTGEYTIALHIDTDPAVRAALTLNAPSFVAPVAITFTDASLGGPTSRTWRLDGATLSRDATLTHTFAQPGDFTVDLESCNAQGCDTWAASLTIVTETDGGSILPRQSVFGAIDRPADSDDWTFDGIAGQRVTLRALDLGAGLDTALELRDANGIIIAFDDDSGGNLLLLTDIELPADGTYTVRIRSFDDAETGPYQLDFVSQS